MEIKISDELNGIIRYAREEAMRTGSYGIGPDHLFLGMMRQADNEACKVLVGLGVDINEFKRFIDSHIFTNESIPYSESDKISFSRYAQNVLSITVMEASKMNASEATSLHLMLALCRTTENYGQAYLRQQYVIGAHVSLGQLGPCSDLGSLLCILRCFKGGLNSLLGGSCATTLGIRYLHGSEQCQNKQNLFHDIGI